jgi:hypothetical protein
VGSTDECNTSLILRNSSEVLEWSSVWQRIGGGCR